MTDKLMNPTIKFDIKLPQSDERIQNDAPILQHQNSVLSQNGFDNDVPKLNRSNVSTGNGYSRQKITQSRGKI